MLQIKNIPQENPPDLIVRIVSCKEYLHLLMKHLSIQAFGFCWINIMKWFVLCCKLTLIISIYTQIDHCTRNMATAPSLPMANHTGFKASITNNPLQAAIKPIRIFKVFRQIP